MKLKYGKEEIRLPIEDKNVSETPPAPAGGVSLYLLNALRVMGKPLLKNG